jgi:hypothetical protein
MPALVAGIHALTASQINEDVDGRDAPGHDTERWFDMSEHAEESATMRIDPALRVIQTKAEGVFIK